MSSIARKSADELLLIVEDVDEDYDVFTRILRQASFPHALQRCTDGEDALDYLYGRGAYAGQPRRRPSVILLDLNLPGTDGREVLAQIKSDSALKATPVVVLTTSSNPRDIDFCYATGANSYIQKPVDLALLAHNIRTALHYWFDLVLLPV